MTTATFAGMTLSQVEPGLERYCRYGRSSKRECGARATHRLDGRTTREYFCRAHARRVVSAIQRGR